MNELSPRQQQVYELIRHGLPAREVAQRLGISPGTVASHIQEIFNRKQAHSVRDLRATVEVSRLPKNLTNRQSMILSAIVIGKSNKEIAEEIGISDRTVDTHIHHMLRRLNVKSRYQAIQLVMAGNS